MINKYNFYKEIYYHEFQRKDGIDSSIVFPVTLFTLMVAGSFFLIEKIDFKNAFFGLGILNHIITILMILFIISLITAIFYLSKTYLNMLGKYNYLPFASELQNREIELEEYYKEFYEEQEYSDKKKRNKIHISKEKAFTDDLVGYYVDYSTHNQEINDKRLKYHYRTRQFLVISLGILLLLTVSILIKL